MYVCMVVCIYVCIYVCMNLTAAEARNKAREASLDTLRVCMHGLHVCSNVFNSRRSAKYRVLKGSLEPLGMCEYVYIYTYIRLWVCVSTCMCVCIYMHVYLRICIYVH